MIEFIHNMKNMKNPLHLSSKLTLCTLLLTFQSSLAHIKRQLPIKLPAYQHIVQQATDSGYFYLICEHITEAYSVCAQDGEQNQYAKRPVYETCSDNGQEETKHWFFAQNEGEEAQVDSEEECRNQNNTKEMACRQEVLRYYAQMYEAQQVYEAYRDLGEARGDLIDRCRTISLSNDSMHPFPLVKGSPEEDSQLAEAFSGASEPCLSDDADNSCAWEFDMSLSLPLTAIQIGDKFSIDLDLYFTAENMRDLFSFKLKRYDEVCSIVRSLLSSDDSNEVNSLTGTLTSMGEFNYLSESTEARDTLYHICTFDSRVSQEKQDLLAYERVSYDLLFQ